MHYKVAIFFARNSDSTIMTAAVKIQTSDMADFSSGVTTHYEHRPLPSSNSQSGFATYEGIIHTFHRYLRFYVSFTITQHPAGYPNYHIRESEIYNAFSKGATAALSLEIKDAFDEWFELVSAQEMGTIAEGTKTIKSFGEALGNKALPATQDRLRFVLTVTGGGIETGVSVMRVA